MYRQVGAIALNENGLAWRGVLVRHLIMPNNVAQTRRVLEELAAISPHMAVSLMAQYFPTNRANKIPEIARGITREEYEDAVAALEELGLGAGYVQEFSDDFGSGKDFCVPDWRDPRWATPAAITRGSAASLRTDCESCYAPAATCAIIRPRKRGLI
jgi:putative pyruvate formate lyase activating enzyme